MKKLAAPLQAFAMFILCLGMGWMVFVLAGINPAPPTATDLQARGTEDMSLASMNSTAVALAKQMLANMVPSPAGRIVIPVTGRGTATPSPVVLITLRAVSTFSNTSTPFSLYTYLFSPTASQEKPNKPAATATRLLVTTATLRPSTLTATPTPVQTKPPSPTPLPPTLVDTPTNPPTNTPRTPSPTSPLPTNTPKHPSPTQPTSINTPRPPSPTSPPPTNTPQPPTPTTPPRTNTPRPPSPTPLAPTNTPVPPATSKPTRTLKPTHTPKGLPATSPPPTNPPSTEPPPTPLASTSPQGPIADRTQPGSRP